MNSPIVHGCYAEMQKRRYKFTVTPLRCAAPGWHRVGHQGQLSNFSGAMPLGIETDACGQETAGSVRWSSKPVRRNRTRSPAPARSGTGGPQERIDAGRDVGKGRHAQRQVGRHAGGPELSFAVKLVLEELPTLWYPALA